MISGRLLCGNNRPCSCRPKIRCWIIREVKCFGSRKFIVRTVGGLFGPAWSRLFWFFGGRRCWPLKCIFSENHWTSNVQVGVISRNLDPKSTGWWFLKFLWNKFLLDLFLETIQMILSMRGKNHLYLSEWSWWIFGIFGGIFNCVEKWKFSVTKISRRLSERWTWTWTRQKESQWDYVILR